MPESNDIVKASGKEIQIINEEAVKKVITKLEGLAVDKTSVDNKVRGYVKRFNGLQGLGDTAYTMNYDFNNAIKWETKELARKIDIDTIDFILTAQKNFTASVQAESNAAKNTASLVKPTNTIPEPPKTASLSGSLINTRNKETLNKNKIDAAINAAMK